MRLGWTVLLLAFSVPSGAGDSKVASDCTFAGRKLYGKVQVVDAFPDIEIQYVSALPGL